MHFLSNAAPYANVFSLVPTAVDAVHRLSTEEQIELLCLLCDNVKERSHLADSVESLYGGQVRPLVSKLVERSTEEQLKAIKALMSGQDIPLGRSYGLLSSSRKLAFGYRLSELIRHSTLCILLSLMHSRPGRLRHS